MGSPTVRSYASILTGEVDMDLDEGEPPLLNDEHFSNEVPGFISPEPDSSR